MKKSERLVKALEFLKANHWVQLFNKTASEMEGGGYGYCAEGCIRWGGFPELAGPFGREPEGDEVEELLAFMNKIVLAFAKDNAQAKRFYGWPDELYVYNDQKDRTKEDIIALFERAIEKAKEEVAA